ncbi:ABC transporter permease [Acuticoccus kandeliae]|uniref:ABC transporter permease n=1 Tax=Acuticoccus kandeliae TaxID=2073160 RepID=UPI000D3EA256|nr:ABC transporter permease [Acuticoccus kandeliae]
MRIKNTWALVLLGLPVAFLTAFFIVPFLVVVVTSLKDAEGAWTGANYARMLGDVYYLETMLVTLRIALWVVITTFVIGYPLAYYMTMVVKNKLIRRLFYVIIVVPLFTSNIVRAFGWIVLLGRRGLVNDALLSLGIIERPILWLYTETSIVIGLSYIMTPFMVLTIASVLQNIDRSLLDAARDLGGSAPATFWLVTFPLSIPGVVAGSLIVFTLSVSAYVTPAILSGGKVIVMPMLIFQQYASVFNFQFGATLAVGLLVTTFIIIIAYLFCIERKGKTA